MKNIKRKEGKNESIKTYLIEDFNEIKSPSSLKYSPDEKTLAFTIVQPDKENNKYSKNLWIMEENKEAVQLTSSGKDGDFIWEDEQTILFVSERSEKKDDLERENDVLPHQYSWRRGKSRRFLFQGLYPFSRSFQMAYIVWESKKIEIHFH